MNRIFEFFSHVAWVAIVVAVVTCPSSALGQDTSDAATIAAARALAIEGVKLANAAQCELAVEKLQRAQALHPSPVVLGRLGECRVALGRLVEGTEDLRRLLREPVPENASEAVRDAFIRANRVLAEAAPRIATLNVTVRGVSPDEVTVTLDGKPVPNAALGVDLPTDPGEHRLEATAPGYHLVNQNVSLGTAQRLVVVLPLEATPPEAAAAVAPETSPAAQPKRTSPAPQTPAQPASPRDPVTDHPEPRSSSLIPGISLLTLGALGVGVGTAFGLAAKSDRDELTERCPGNVCSPDDDEALSKAKTKGTVATVAVGAGAAAMVLGVILLVTSNGDGEEAATTPGLEVAEGTHAWIGLGEVGLSGHF